MYVHKANIKFQKSNSKLLVGINECLLFGPETRGLPSEVLNNQTIENIRIPMKADSRSLNLSNTAAIVLYQALADNNFCGLI